MKTTTTIKQTLLALTIALSIVSCKKDKDAPTAPPSEVKAMTFTELKALSTGASVKVPDAKKITGIVISDASTKNIDSKTVVLQEATGQPGLIVTFDAAQTFAVGDQLEITVSNQTLAQVNGEIVLQNIPAANAKKTGTGTITAKATTTIDIITNKAAWDGTLVTLSDGSFSGDNGDGKYNGSLTYTDATGTVKSIVLAGAAFAGSAYPVLVNTVTGIVRVNGTDVSVDIRNTTDVAGNSNITRKIIEDFSTLALYNSYTIHTDQMGTNLASGILDFRAPLSGDDLPTGRNYAYLDRAGTSMIFGFTSFGATSLKGLKQVSVTLLPSKFTGDIDGQHVASFNSSTQTNGIDILLWDASGFNGYKVAFVSYKDVGVSHTFTYNQPATVSEMETALIGGGQTEADAKTLAPTLLSIENPILSMQNNSSARTTTPNEYQPIVIQKIVFGFDK